MRVSAVTLSLILGAVHILVGTERPKHHRLTSEGPMTPKAISSTVDLAPRTVSFALRKLMGKSLCKKIPNLSDMRQPLYAADMERAKALRTRFEHVFRQVLV